jgi:hypothetical protein
MISVFYWTGFWKSFGSVLLKILNIRSPICSFLFFPKAQGFWML